MEKPVAKLDINVGRHSYKVLLFCPYLNKFEFLSRFYFQTQHLK